MGSVGNISVQVELAVIVPVKFRFKTSTWRGSIGNEKLAVLTSVILLTMIGFKLLSKDAPFQTATRLVGVARRVAAMTVFH